MPKKKLRRKNKTNLSGYFKELKEGDIVALIPSKSIPFFLPKRIIGLTGEITGKKGDCNIVTLKQGYKAKQFIIPSAHLKKVKSS